MTQWGCNDLSSIFFDGAILTGDGSQGRVLVVLNSTARIVHVIHIVSNSMSDQRACVLHLDLWDIAGGSFRHRNRKTEFTTGI